jgi:hypothetical protein
MTILHLIHLNFQILSYTWYNSVESVNISPISSISQITEVFVFDTRFPPRPVICSDTNIGCDSDTNVFFPFHSFDRFCESGVTEGRTSELLARVISYASR